MSDTEHGYYFVSSLEKGLRILELLSHKDGMSSAEVARALNMHRSGSHRFLSTLKELGYVRKDRDGRYRLTYRVVKLGIRVVEHHEILRFVWPYMNELSQKFNETVNLGYFDGEAVLHIGKIDSKEILRMDTPIWSRAPAYCSGLGKAILAFLEEDELSEYLKRTVLEPQGPNTITSEAALRRELEKVRECGYSIDNEEFSEGLRCVSAPIFDHIGGNNYAISISGPSLRMTDEKIRAIQPVVQQRCRELSEKLGSTG